MTSKNKLYFKINFQKYEPKIEDAYNYIDAKQENGNKYSGKFLKGVLSMKYNNKNEIIDEKSKISNDKLNNFLNIIRYDSTLLKNALLGSNQCINEVNNIYLILNYKSLFN